MKSSVEYSRLVKTRLRTAAVRMYFAIERRRNAACRRPTVASYITSNWGDAFNTELAFELFGERPVIADLDAVYPRIGESQFPNPIWFLIGSVLHHARTRATVWGSGLLRDTQLKARPTVLGVRGTLTAEVLSRHGFAPNPPLGDPALLLRYMPAARTAAQPKRYRFGIIPHYIDAKLPSVANLASRLGGRVISIRSATAPLVAQITACEAILSSSLHGLIAAHALGVPYAWIQFKQLPPGGAFKFRDFFSTFGRDASELPHAISADLCTQHTVTPTLVRPVPIDLRRMIDAFPISSSFLSECYRRNSDELAESEWPPINSAT